MEVILYAIIFVMILLHIRSFYLLQQFKKTKNEIERSNQQLEDQLQEFLSAVEIKNQELVSEVEGYIATAQKPVVRRQEVSIPVENKQEVVVPVKKKPAPKKKPTPSTPTHVAATYQQNAGVGSKAADELEQIRLYDKQGKTVSEIAALLGRAESEVNLLLFMARKESNG
ncbi:hypothetical protein ACFO0S_09335 [Chryseomicrobium palamuruense]|uniref:Swarming motility protein SwrB n=1 Tax=Chryseomicrobium palamuruense TaxID=682973 RepID=A0ABV8UV94_9BACL